MRQFFILLSRPQGPWPPQEGKEGRGKNRQLQSPRPVC